MVKWCCMCKCSYKTVDCLLLHCLFASALWSFVFSVLGLNYYSLVRLLCRLYCDVYGRWCCLLLCLCKLRVFDFMGL